MLLEDTDKIYYGYILTHHIISSNQLLKYMET